MPAVPSPTIQVLRNRLCVKGDVSEEELRLLLAAVEDKYHEEVSEYNKLPGAAAIGLEGQSFLDTPDRIIHRLETLQAQLLHVRKLMKDANRYLTEAQSEKVFQVIRQLNL